MTKENLETFLFNWLTKLHISPSNDSKSSHHNIAIAVSGGCDSLALATAAHKAGFHPYCIIVDHKLRPTSTAEAVQVSKILTDMSIKNTILTWRHEPIKSNIANKARQARYTLITEECLKNNIGNVLLGHHMEDQVETFLLNLIRGSGLNGLCAMSEITLMDKIYLLRPLLQYSKKDLMSYLQAYNIEWIEDESNRNIHANKRNKLRHLLNQMDNSELITKRINNTIIRLQSARLIIDKNRSNHLSAIEYNQDKNEHILSQSYYLQLEPEERLSLTSDILMRLNNSKKRGRLDSLIKISHHIAETPFKPRTIMHTIITLKKGNIIFRPEKSVGIAAKILETGAREKDVTGT